MRIAIYGAGSLGTILGALLSAHYPGVELITRNADHVHALNLEGARIVGTLKGTYRVRALLPAQMEGTYDVVFLLTKQQDNAQVARQLKSYLSPTGVLCTMQNGLPEAQLQRILGPSKVLGCAIGWGASLIAPGVVEMTSGRDTFVFNLGLPPSGSRESLDRVAAILSTVGTVVTESDFLGARWSKLVVNASFSGMSTVLGGSFKEVIDDRVARRYAQCIVKECIDVAKALHITLAPIQGKDIVRLFDYHTRWKRWISFHLIPIALGKHRQLRPSMLADLERGRVSEVDAIQGAVARHGREVGVKTPVTDRVIDIIHEIERGEAVAGHHNLARFAEVCH